MGRYWRRLRVGVIAGDVLAVLGAYTVAAGAHFGFGHIQFAGFLWPVYPILTAAVALVTLVLAWQYGTYRRWALFGGHKVYPLLSTVATYSVLIVIVLSYVMGGTPLVSRGWLATAWLGSIVSLSLGRVLWRQVALHWRRQGKLVRKVLIAGANQHGIAVARQLHDPALHGTLVLGFLDDYQRPGTEIVSGLKVVGHPGSVLEWAKILGADEVIMIAGALAWESQRLLAEMVTRPEAPIDARISPTFYDLLTTSADLTHVAYVPMLSLTHTRLSGINAVAKALMDSIGAAVLLVLLSPLFLAWRVKASWLGVPMFERRGVLGVRGNPFDLLELDPRLAASPVFARLPALWNVVCQRLSLVGPRPMRAGELPSHEPWLSNLFAMKPGLTGLWRLRGRELSVEERVALDLYYVRNYTVTQDLQILFHTARELGRRASGYDDGLARWGDLGPAPAAPVAPATPSELPAPGGAEDPRPAPRPVGSA